jgi:hypothetical protein
LRGISKIGNTEPTYGRLKGKGRISGHLPCLGLHIETIVTVDLGTAPIGDRAGHNTYDSGFTECKSCEIMGHQYLRAPFERECRHHKKFSLTEWPCGFQSENS